MKFNISDNSYSFFFTYLLLLSLYKILNVKNAQVLIRIFAACTHLDFLDQTIVRAAKQKRKKGVEYEAPFLCILNIYVCVLTSDSVNYKTEHSGNTGINDFMDLMPSSSTSALTIIASFLKPSYDF